MRPGKPVNIGVRCGDLRFTVPMQFYSIVQPMGKAQADARVRAPFDASVFHSAMHNISTSEINHDE